MKKIVKVFVIMTSLILSIALYNTAVSAGDVEPGDQTPPIQNGNGNG